MKYFYYCIVGASLVVLLPSCLTERKAVKRLDKIRILYPNLLSSKSDTTIKDKTFTFTTPSVSIDTTVAAVSDSATVEKDGVKTTVKRSQLPDGQSVFHIKTDVAAKPLTFTVRDTVIVNHTKVTTAVKEVIPVWVWWVMGALSGLALYFRLFKYMGV